MILARKAVRAQQGARTFRVIAWAANVRFPPIADISIGLQTGRMKPILCCLALVVALVGCSSVPHDPTLCELTGNSSAFRGRTVTVEGTLLVSKHGSAVTDAK